jgi:hypothetical protein
MSIIKPTIPKALIESKAELDMSNLKKDFLEVVPYLEKIAIIHDEYDHVVDHKKTGNSGKDTSKCSNACGRSSRYNLGGSSSGGGSNTTSNRDRTKSGHGRSSDSSFFSLTM